MKFRVQFEFEAADLTLRDIQEDLREFVSVYHKPIRDQIEASLRVETSPPVYVENSRCDVKRVIMTRADGTFDVIGLVSLDTKGKWHAQEAGVHGKCEADFGSNRAAVTWLATNREH